MDKFSVESVKEDLEKNPFSSYNKFNPRNFPEFQWYEPTITIAGIELQLVSEEIDRGNHEDWRRQTTFDFPAMTFEEINKIHQEHLEREREIQTAWWINRIGRFWVVKETKDTSALPEVKPRVVSMVVED